MRLPDDLWTTDYAYVVDGGQVNYMMVARNAYWTQFKHLNTRASLVAFRDLASADAEAKSNLRRKERLGR